MRFLLFLLSIQLLPVTGAAESLYSRLVSDPASVSVCSLYSETAFREQLGYEGTFFSQSVDDAYQRLAEEGSRSPDFAGCWWRMTEAAGGFVMMQVTMHPVTEGEARRRIDEQLKVADGVDSPLLPGEITGLGEAGLWSPLNRRVRWRQTSDVIVELMISERVVPGSKRRFHADQLKSMAIANARIISNRLEVLGE